jgi:chromosome segregation ATPase
VIYNTNSRISNLGSLLQISTEKTENCLNLQKRGIENIQKIEKQVNSNQVILADNNQKIFTMEQMMQKTESQIDNSNQELAEITSLLKYNQQYMQYLDNNMIKLNKENNSITISFKNENVERLNALSEEISKIYEELIERKKCLEEQIKIGKDFMLQNKMVNNAVCGEIEKLEEIIKSQNNQMNNLENNITIIMNEISNIQERIIENENNFSNLPKMIKSENMGTKKVITEMVNNRISSIEKMLKDVAEGIMKKLGGLEKENAELREKLTEIQTEIKEKSSNENPRKNRKSSESDEDHPRRKKSSGSSSSHEDNNGTTINKVCAQEVLEKFREPEIEVKSASGKIEKRLVFT